MTTEEIFRAVLIGTAVGDALGLPRERLSRRRARKMFGGPPLRHRLVFGRGMISDDAEHTCMAAQALIVSRGDPERFARSFAWRLRWWLIGIPAGIGSATLRGILKLWMGFPPQRSGVFSAGNGPAMRAAILGAYSAAAKLDDDVLRKLVRASTRITHTDPAAEQGALAVAVAARIAVMNWDAEVSPVQTLDAICAWIESAELRRRFSIAKEHLLRAATPEEFAGELGLGRGVSGYVLNTVPVAIYCWLRWRGDFRQTVESAILLGGDADTVGAIVGGLAAISAGARTIPREWTGGIADWPRSTKWMEKLAARLAESLNDPNADAPRPQPLFWPAIVPRNAIFFLVVMLHGFRRLLPPY